MSDRYVNKMKYIVYLAWKDLQRRLFASTVAIAQLFIVGMLIIWISVSVPGVYRSLDSFFNEDTDHDEMVFVDAGINRMASTDSDAFKTIESLCDVENSGCSVIGLNQDWLLIVGAIERSGQLRLEEQVDINFDQPFILLGSQVGVSVEKTMPWPDTAIRSTGAGLHPKQSNQEVIMAGRLGNGAYFINSSGKYLLSSRKILCMSFKQFCEYNGNLSLFFTGFQLHDQSPTKIADLTNLMLSDKSVSWFRPISIKDHRQKQLFNAWGGIYFIVFVIVFYTLILSGMVIYLIQMIEGNQREYAIHRICGASLRNIKLRILFFICFIVSVPAFFLILSLFTMSGDGFEVHALLYLLTITFITILLVYIYPARQIASQDIAGFTRPD